MKNIAVVVYSRANFGRCKSLLHALKDSKDFKLTLVSGASALTDRFGSSAEFIEKEGFTIDEKVTCLIDSSEPEAQAITAGVSTIQLAGIFKKINPDAVLLVADRYETLSISIAASYQNIPVIHLQGGEISGNIDDKVRNANTALADYHFVATKKSKERVIKMGINRSRVYNSGCPALDLLKSSKKKVSLEALNTLGVGDIIDFAKPYFLISQHPLTTDIASSEEHMSEIIKASSKFSDHQKVVIWPNADAGNAGISKAIRKFREKDLNLSGWRFLLAIPPDEYAELITKSSCLIGNSSSFIRESSYLGVPSIVVGDRQKGREIGKNVILTKPNENALSKSIKKHLTNNNYRSDNLYGDGNAASKIMKQLRKIDFDK